jgi:hypothetical protein
MFDQERWAMFFCPFFILASKKTTKPVFLGLSKVGEKYARILRLLRKSMQISSNSYGL